MKYLGGKERISKELSQFLTSQRKEGQLYIEPFVGGCSVFSKMDGPKVAGDIHQDLILMYIAIQNGWIPPDTISEEEYQVLRYSEPSALRAFAGFGCSFGGKWFGGYAREGKRGERNFAKSCKNGLLKIKPMIERNSFLHGTYEQFSNVTNTLIYCDIPYAHTTKYSMNFDHNKFYDWVHLMSKTNKVFVSSYEMPSDFVCVWEKVRNLELRSKEGSTTRVEKVFTIKETI